MRSATDLEVQVQPEAPGATGWSLATRLAFRFCFCYFCLFFVDSPVSIFLPFRGFLLGKYTEFWYAVVVRLESHLLHTGLEVY
jgi:hypothetical protein